MLLIGALIALVSGGMTCHDVKDCVCITMSLYTMVPSSVVNISISSSVCPQ